MVTNTKAGKDVRFYDNGLRAGHIYIIHKQPVFTLETKKIYLNS